MEKTRQELEHGRGWEIFAMCNCCGRLLPVDISITPDGEKFTSKKILFHHSSVGIFCPYCQPDVMSKISDEPDATTAAEKERMILDALDEHIHDGLSVSQLVEKLHLIRTTIYRRIEVLEQRGDVVKKDHKYFLNHVA